jgi:hypothetical protein
MVDCWWIIRTGRGCKRLWWNNVLYDDSWLWAGLDVTKRDVTNCQDLPFLYIHHSSHHPPFHSPFFDSLHCVLTMLQNPVDNPQHIRRIARRMTKIITVIMAIVVLLSTVDDQF